jgi:hypothetical protein
MTWMPRSWHAEIRRLSHDSFSAGWLTALAYRYSAEKY